MASIRWIFALIAAAMMLSGAPALAQDNKPRATSIPDPQGLWEGTLAVTPRNNLHLFVKLTRAEDGALTGTLDSPDQNAFDIPLAEITLEGSVLSFAVSVVGARYQGSWDAQGAVWSGNWFQSGQSWPLSFAAADEEARPEPVLLPAQWSVPDNETLAALLEKRIAERPGAGIVLGVIEPAGTRIIARGPISYRDAGTETPASFDGDTIFEIGSMTKVFTALLLADLALDGTVTLDDPVVDHLPEGAVMPTRNGAQITLRQLSLQTSGLPRLPSNMPYGDAEDPYADYTEALLLEFLAGYELPRDIGSEYEYSNLGVGLLGYALAHAAGTDYENLLRQRILDPLAMMDTAITLPPGMAARFATPHDTYMRPTKPWAVPVIGGAGALRSSVNDMLLFLAAALDPQSPIGPAMELTLSDISVEGEGSPNPALGWMLANPPTGQVLHHGGGTGGFRSHMTVQRATGTAIVGLSNAAIEPSATDLVMHATFGSPAANEAPVPPPPPQTPEQDEITLEPAQLDRLVGSYQMAPGVEMSVAREGDGITAQLTGQPTFRIYAVTPLEFFLKVVAARLVFAETEGEITSATLFQNGREILMKRIG